MSIKTVKLYEELSISFIYLKYLNNFNLYRPH